MVFRARVFAKVCKSVNYVIKLILKKYFLGKPVFLTQRSFKLMLERSGFELLGVGQDGETSFDLDSKCGSSESFYEPRKIGKEGDHRSLCYKTLSI